MMKLRTAVMAAATALATVPGLAPAQSPPDQNRDWHGRGDHGDHGNRGDRGFQNGGQPNGAQQAQPAPAVQPNPGGRPDGGGQGQRWPGRDDRSRGQDDRRFAPVDQHPDYRGQQGDRRGFDGRGGPDGRGGGDRDRGRNDGYRGRDYGFAGRDAGYDRGYDRRPGWDRGHAAGWRDDRRYDWQGWRNQNRALFRGPRYVAPRGFGYRPYAVGYRLPPFFYGRTYWIDDPYAFRLPPAEGPYRWVRYYNDVLLVDLRSGAVVDVIRQFFW